MDAPKVKCKICGQLLNIRKKSSVGSFPVQHKRPDSIQLCHGFYENGVN